MKARPGLRRSSGTRRRAGGSPRSPCGASTPLPGEHDQSGCAPGTPDRGRASARPEAGGVRPRCGGTGLSDALRPGGGPGCRDPGLCAATEQAYDATGDEAPRPRRDDAFNPEQLMHELEDFLRQERRARRLTPPTAARGGAGKVSRDPREVRTRPGESSPIDAALQSSPRSDNQQCLFQAPTRG